MKIAFRKYKYSWFVVFCSVAILAIVACNVWLLYCGRCVYNDCMSVPPIGWVLIVANLVAALVFFAVKSRKKTEYDVSLCASCHIRLRELWGFCPNCGQERRA